MSLVSLPKNFQLNFLYRSIISFSWKWKQRIQVTMSGQHSNEAPVELHDQQLIFPEHRFTEHIGEDEQVMFSDIFYHDLFKDII